MKKFQIYRPGEETVFLLENETYEGVGKVAGCVAGDIGMVTGEKLKLAEAGTKLPAKTGHVILPATYGHSPLLEELSREGKLDLSGLCGKREVYLWQIVEKPFPERPEVEDLLVVAGSDKRGTIYGLFSLSEHCGVSPLVYWGDVMPVHREELELSLEGTYLSKEPSVEYRGFFINDEWPAFGNWSAEKFGGCTAGAYEKVFELLLRLKGNYLWPAMWNSSFSEDGPGLENARLADIYGVIMGTSHHEPLCRAGVEWQNIYRRYGEDSTWSFLSNEKAITAFWEDGLKRNRDFENLITIGMRGENDSKLLPEDAGLADNIEVVKKAIRAQHNLIRKNINADLKQVPRMLAIYKEVEDYYYGSPDCPGLKDWEELEDVILMLCDDNFGNTRGLPEPGERVHPGGYGMYYHFDYHGGPISYEWQNSVRLTKTWEQLTQAYEYGVRRLWIVNVGDVKGVEYPLNYFMDLAYDYETWGVSATNKTEHYLEQWIRRQFGERISPAQEREMKEVIDGWTKWNAARKPEAMNPEVYHPVHFREGERVREAVLGLMEKAARLKECLPEECLPAYCSMVYYPAVASLNLIAMQAEAGMNAWLAEQGSLRANSLGESVKRRIRTDRELVAEYHALAGGKWNHMMDSAHTGFRSWNDYNWTYPAVREVMPIPGGKALIRFRGSEKYCMGRDWVGPEPLCNDDFTRPDLDEIVIDIDSRGEEGFAYEIDCVSSLLDFQPQAGRVEPLEEGGVSVRVACNRESMSGIEVVQAGIKLSFDSGKKDFCRLLIKIAGREENAENVPDVFAERQGLIVMEAAHYREKRDMDGSGWQIIRHLGRMGDAVKVFPVTEDWTGRADRPWAAYDFLAGQEGNYHLELWCASRNPVRKGEPMRCLVSVNGEEPVSCQIVSSALQTGGGGEWSQGVLDNIHKSRVTVSVRRGRNRLCLYAGNPGIVVERLILYPEGTCLPQSYLGPAESCQCIR